MHPGGGGGGGGLWATNADAIGLRRVNRYRNWSHTRTLFMLSRSSRPQHLQPGLRLRVGIALCCKCHADPQVPPLHRRPRTPHPPARRHAPPPPHPARMGASRRCRAPCRTMGHSTAGRSPLPSPPAALWPAPIRPSVCAPVRWCCRAPPVQPAMGPRDPARCGARVYRCIRVPEVSLKFR